METIYMYFCLPETLHLAPDKTAARAREASEAKSSVKTRSSSLAFLTFIHFYYLFFFSGIQHPPPTHTLTTQEWNSHSLLYAHPIHRR